MSATLFISDLHLDPARPGIVDLFLQFLRGPVQDSEALYILGDLFEVWIGDDNGTSEYDAVMDGLRQCTNNGIPIFLMHGNRDFLLGDEFMGRTGCTLLADPTVINCTDEPILLMHGDTLCIGDKGYQDFRIQVRDQKWQQRFLSKTIAERKHIASDLRESSRTAVQDKTPEIMDVDPQAVEDAFRYHKVRYMIHGHTHRPGIHQLSVDGKSVQRIVLGDWYKQGSVLQHRSGNFQLQALRTDLKPGPC